MRLRREGDGLPRIHDDSNCDQTDVKEDRRCIQNGTTAEPITGTIFHWLRELLQIVVATTRPCVEATNGIDRIRPVCVGRST